MSEEDFGDNRVTCKVPGIGRENTVGPQSPWVPHLWIQPTVGQKYEKKLHLYRTLQTCHYAPYSTAVLTASQCAIFANHPAMI
jgi:hypothetical protein